MGIISDGNSYGVPDDLLYSFPVTIKVKYFGDYFPCSFTKLDIFLDSRSFKFKY